MMMRTMRRRWREEPNKIIIKRRRVMVTEVGEGGDESWPSQAAGVGGWRGAHTHKELGYDGITSRVATVSACFRSRQVVY